MPGNTSDPFDLAGPLGRNPTPHGDSALGKSKPGSEPGNKTALSAQEIDPVHAADISANTRDLQAENISPTNSDTLHTVAVELGRIIAQARRRAGWTQLQLARRIHVKQSAVAQWETGRAIPNLENRFKLAAMLGVSLERLLLPEGGGMPPLVLDNLLERQLIECVRVLDERDKRALLILAVHLRENPDLPRK